MLRNELISITLKFQTVKGTLPTYIAKMMNKSSDTSLPGKALFLNIHPNKQRSSATESSSFSFHQISACITAGHNFTVKAGMEAEVIKTQWKLTLYWPSFHSTKILSAVIFSIVSTHPYLFFEQIS